MLCLRFKGGIPLDESLEELKKNLSTLADILRSVKMNEESENLRQWSQQMFAEIERLQKYVRFYCTAEFTLSNEQMNQILKKCCQKI